MKVGEPWDNDHMRGHGVAPNSAFIGALNRGDQTPGNVSYTSIYSTLVDELITPNATAALIDGASNLEMQALCRGRVVTHVSIVSDAAVFAVVMDALGQPGPATAARFNRAACLQTAFVGVPGTLGGLQLILSPHRVPTVSALPAVEPPLRPYARQQSSPAVKPASSPAPTTARAPARSGNPSAPTSRVAAALRVRR